MEELIVQAQDYLGRLRPDERLDQVREWGGGVCARMSLGTLSVEDARKVYEYALRYLKVQMRIHRFPGVALSRAIEAAIKSLHYERVMNAVVGRKGRS
jgi:hypothetical protein